MYPIFNLEECDLCPRKCYVNRVNGELGYCNCSSEPLISSIFLHKGEEPVLSGITGICNVFFAHCNMQCIFCQNYQISCNRVNESNWSHGYEEIVESIVIQLDKGVELLGFVSPTHQVHQMVKIIGMINKRGYSPKIVYNTNCYDSVETLKKLEGIVDIYLPDFKYFDSNLGLQFSDVPDYFEIASLAFREMYRQKGSVLIVNENGIAESGIIVRHLVIPEHSMDSIKVLEFLAESYSNKLHISLMAQYYPIDKMDKTSAINRRLTHSEYSKVLSKVEDIGFRGWVQDIKSAEFYRPDFSNILPF